MVQKIYSKMYLVSCTNTHRDVTDLVNHGMVKNRKTWISWEQNIIFLWNKKILDLCLWWHILRSYDFAVEVTFKETYRNQCFKIKKSIYNKLKDKKVTKIFVCLSEIYFNNMMERKRLQTKPNGRLILWQPVNFEILACSYFYILMLASYIFWIRNKQKQRIT